MGIYAVEQFLAGKRVLYAAPTSDQTEAFWFEVKLALQDAIDAGAFVKNESLKTIELAGTKQRIRAKTAYNADTLRGDFADVLILDEYQDMDSDAWDKVGSPMLIDNGGEVTFIFTFKRGNRHTQELIAKAKKSERWEFFSFSSYDNPFISKQAIDELAEDMDTLTFRMEILAEEIEDNPSALWARSSIKYAKIPEDFVELIVAVDPSGSSVNKNECGIIIAGSKRIDDVLHAFIIADWSISASPGKWALRVVQAFEGFDCDWICGETNFGGDMVQQSLISVAEDYQFSFVPVRASRGKEIRAAPVVAMYERNRVHHNEGADLNKLEDEQCGWVPGVNKWSPNRLDALVIAVSYLLLKKRDRPSTTITTPLTEIAETFGF